MIHPATELRLVNPHIGYGVFATQPIPMGTIVWTLCQLDMILGPAQRQALPEPYQPIIEKYAYSDGTGNMILCWDYGRFINHSCAPAMLGVGDSFEIAVRDIAAGEELTCDYATLDLSEPMGCTCGQDGCSGAVDNCDLLHRYAQHDARVASALRNARSVAQPLLAFARQPEQFWAWADGREPLPSHRTFYREST